MRTVKNISFSKSYRRFKQFLSETSGNATLTLALSAVPLFLVGGVAVDYSRISQEQVAFYNAVDAAAIAIAADDRSAIPDNLSPSDKAARQGVLKKVAEDYIKQNYDFRAIDGDHAESLDVKLTITGQKITIDAELEFPTLFTSFTGFENAKLSSHTVVNKTMRPVELALVLDTTGSMKNDMVGLKSAANKLLATLYQDPSFAGRPLKSEYIRTTLVPFSAAVRLDKNAYDFNLNWIDTAGVNPLSHINFNDPTWNNYNAWEKVRPNNTSYHTWNGCVESRKQGAALANYIVEDTAPSDLDIHSKFPAYFNPDSPSWMTSGSPSSPSSTYYTSNNSSSNSGIWSNNYINPFTNYVTSGTSNATLLAPAGANRTGYDDSVIGNRTFDLTTRFKNVAKYQNKVIGNETFTLAGDGVSWSAPNGPWRNCTASKVVPMTYDRTKIETGITSMKAYGGTNIAEGLAWGMRALSPSEPFTKVEGAPGIPATTISPYNGPRWQKVMVLMTDGQNDPYVRYNNGSAATLTDTGTSYNSFGMVNTTTTGNLNRYGSTNFNDADNTLDTYTEKMCDALKDNGVTIYTVSFRVTSSLMENCATSPAHAKFGNSPEDLVALFDGIGKDVLNKMVYISESSNNVSPD